MTVKAIEKKCRKCCKIYPATLEYFNKDRNGLRSRCKVCIREEAKERTRNGYKAPGRKATLHKYNNSDKGKVAQLKYRRTEKGQALNRRAKLKYYYDMTNDDYNQLFQEQQGKCKICGLHQFDTARRLDIDHDHATGEIRGLLCGGCNRHLGKFENGKIFNPYLTEKFLEYLKGNF